MGAAPEVQCHAFSGRQRADGSPQPIGLRERGSCARDGEVDNLKSPLFYGAGFSLPDFQELRGGKCSSLEAA